MVAQVIDKSLVYLTDNSLEPWLAAKCMDNISRASMGYPIISVSQKPINFGQNICVGDIGRSGYCIDFQLNEGLKHVKTKWVFLVEHDCLYTEEHFRFTPPDDRYFWYNDNVWLLQLFNPRCPEWNGMYSYKRKRRVQSQLVCDAQLLKKATVEKMAILSDPAWMERHPDGRLGEPGSADYDRAMKMSDYKTLRHLKKQLKDYTQGYCARDWRTKTPNIDIRHGGNLTGPRRGKNRCFTLPPWGTMDNVLFGQ